MASIRSRTANLTVVSDPADCGWLRPLGEGLNYADPRRRPPALMSAIERQILPQLLRMHPPRRTPIAIATTEETRAVAAYASGSDPSSLPSALDRLLAAGATVDTLCLDILAPAARHLGELWEEDELDFVQVTIGVQRLQHALRMLTLTRPSFGSAAESGTEPGIAPRRRRILVIPAPGSQHSFGVSMVARFFRNAGWDVVSDITPTLDDLGRRVRETYFDIVGISASCDIHVEPLSRSLRVVRQHSCNAAIGTMVGGPLFTMHPELAVQLGADATAQDAAQAPLQAELLLRERQQDAHKPAGFMGGTNLWVVTPEERGGSDRRDTFRDGGNDPRRPRSRVHPSHHPGGG